MAPRPKVPFALHPAAKLRANLDVPRGTGLALSPDGAVAAIVSGDWGQRRLLLHELATGAVTDALPDAAGLALELPVWSPDGRRWALASHRFEGTEPRGVAFAGERGRAAPLCTARLPAYGLISRNDLARPAPPLSFDASGERLVMRASVTGDRNALLHIDVADGAVREHWLDPGEADVYAQHLSPDGTLFTLSADPGDQAGLAWYPPGATAPAGRHRYVFGFTIVPGRRGLWVLGAPRYAFRVGAFAPRPVGLATKERVARAELLRARASAAWDQGCCDRLIERAKMRRSSFNYRVDAIRTGVGHELALDAGAWAFEDELLWESSFAGALGDDDVAVSDGVATWLWRDDGATVTRDLLVDDTQRSTHRTARIVALSTAGDTLALLWKKDARGEKTVLSLFDLDRAALPRG